jgi:hypothetical protein
MAATMPQGRGANQADRAWQLGFGALLSRAMRLTAIAIGVGLLGSAGCLRSAEKTTKTEADETACKGTTEGKACLSLKFAIAEKIRTKSEGDLNGVLRWAMYKDGDVGLMGPGDNKYVLSGESKGPVDLSKPEAVYVVNLPNVTPGKYQVLGYVDDDGNGKDTSGEPVTFPKDGFVVSAGGQTVHDVSFDYLR